MASTLKHLRSSTTNKRPTASGLADGQIAINTASGTPALFFKDNADNVVKVGPVHVGATAPNASPAGSAGNSTGELWVDNSLTTQGLKYYSGSEFINLTPSGTTSAAGLVELATNAETQTGSDAVRAVTPAGLQSKVSDSTSTTSSTTIASATAVKSAYDLANAALPKSGGTVTGEIVISPSGSLAFEGSTDDSFETRIVVTDPTADRTITLPNTTGTVITTGDTGTVTSTMIADGAIVNADINASAAIAPSKLGSGALPNGVTVSSTNIVDGTIVNADVNASAAIAGSKISPDFAGQNVVTTGSVTGASLIPTSSTVPTNGLYLPATNSVALSTNGTGRLFIDASGKIGLGVASPTEEVDIAGDVYMGTGNIKFANNLGIYGYDTTSTIRRLFHLGTDNNLYFNANSLVNAQIFQTNNTERLRITSAGLVGIGTSAPSTLLHLSSATGSASPTPTELRIATTTNASDWSTTDPWGRLSFYSADASGAGPKIHAAIDAVATDVSKGTSTLQFRTSLSDGSLPAYMTLDNTGRLGIGTTSPSTLLHIAAATPILTIEDTSGATASVSRTCFLRDDDSFQHQVRNSSGVFTATAYRVDYGSTGVDAHRWFRANTLEAVRIDSSGRLLVGTSSSLAIGSATNAQIQQTNTSSTPNLALANFVNASSGSYLILGASRGTSVGTYTAVANNDRIATIRFAAADGTDLQSLAGAIECYAEADAASNDTPGRLVFSTTADGASSPTERMRIDSKGFAKFSNTGAYTAIDSHQFRSDSNGTNTFIHSTNGSFTSNVLQVRTTKAGASDYSLAVFASNNGADLEFRFSGDGDGYCDGAWTGGGADYAEYFEWADSNSDAEDRRGISVVLDGDKIREAQAGEDPIGVISGNPSVVGDAAWNKWNGKYLRDEFGTYIQEDYEVTDEDGNAVIQQRRKLNPAYDPGVEYVSREERPEWDCVGLMGKLRIRKGQVTGSRWIKMRDISDSVEEWLVR